MKRLDYVLNIPSPYRLYLLGEVYRQCKERGVDFCAHFMAMGHKGRPDSWLNPDIPFPHRYWRDFGHRCYHFNPGLLIHFLLHPADIIVMGGAYDTFTSVLAPFFIRNKKQRKMVTAVEGNTKNLKHCDGVAGRFKRWCMSHWHLALVPGIDGGRFFEYHQNLTKRKLPETFILPNLVDERVFLPKGKIQIDKALLGISGDALNDRVCIIPSRLSPEKGLVPFFKQLDADTLKGWRICLVGDGIEREILEQTAKDGGFRERVHFLGNVPYEEMPKYYAAADLFLLPSLRDQNPLCVVEALHTGLPIALSDQAGNIEEAVTEGKNGWALPVDRQQQFKGVLQRVFGTSIERLREMGEYSYRHNAQFWNTQLSVTKVMDRICK